MKKNILIFLIVFISFHSSAQKIFEKDSFSTSAGNLTIHFIGHGSLMFDFNGIIVHADPSMFYADYATFPKADAILITHHHSDHLDTTAISKILKDTTWIVLPQASYDKLTKSMVTKIGEKVNFTILKTSNGEKVNFPPFRISVEAVPAYNTTPGKEKFHPKGRDNGYIITFGDKRIYVAGDTENIPEMATFKNIDIAFLPMNLPTMTPEQVTDAVSSFNPKIFYPYHYGDSDVEKLKKLLSANKKVEVRIRSLK